MTRDSAHRILRADAAWDAFAGVMLILGPVDAVGGTLDFPGLFRSFVAPIVGVASLTFAVLLWRVPSASPLYGQTVNVSACWGNALTVLVLLLYTMGLAANLTVGAALALGIPIAVCAAFAYYEDRIARSRALETAPTPA